MVAKEISQITGNKKCKRALYLDRRSGDDRRVTYSLEYFLQGNPDRRKEKERRVNVERRKGYVRVTDWSSAYAGRNKK